MGQLTSNTWRLPTDGAASRDPGDSQLRWLCLLDRLYELVESSDDLWPGGWRQDWPEPWQPLVLSWAAHIGARSIQLVEPLHRRPSLRHPTRLSRRRSLNAQPPAHGPAILAQSLSADGFTASQEREFLAFCSHLYTALALQAELAAARQSLANLYGVVDALPMGVVMLDEQLNVALLNRQAREWLARTEKLVIRGRRIGLSSEQAAFESALQGLLADPFKPHHHLHLNGLDIHLKKLTHPAAPVSLVMSDRLLPAPQEPGGLPFSVLLQIHERCDEARLIEITLPPAALARHLQQQFALTDKELPLAWNLAQGMSLKQYAALSGRSIETGRAQLKSVFRKLGANGQSGIGLVLFEALHMLTLQSMGTQLATAMANHAMASLTPHQPSPWR